jgi:uncharacterized protein (TIGR00251 family)
MPNDSHVPREMQLKFQRHPDGTVVPVRARAGGRQNAILGTREGALRVSVTAAPEKGKANRAIIALLCKALDVPKSAIELLAGDTSPQKRFLVRELDFARIVQTLQPYLANEKQSE